MILGKTITHRVIMIVVTIMTLKMIEKKKNLTKAVIINIVNMIVYSTHEYVWSLFL